MTLRFEAMIILDNLAKQLKSNRDAKAYLIAYAGKTACRDEARSRLLQAKRYLKEKHNIGPEHQVTFVDGGFQTDWVVEIWIGFKQNKPPPKRSTLDKSQIRILKNCRTVGLASP